MIRIRGARAHNLQNVDVDLPRDRLVVITGVSGSGKSSLAFDTLFAEGQRQYIESLSVYARQFLHQLERPDVDLIEGLQPTISIDQRGSSASPRSTAATLTEIYDYLRLLFARCGDPACPNCGTPIRPRTPEQIISDLESLPEGTKLILMAPLVRGRKGQHKEELEEVRKAGFVRVRIDGELLDLDQVELSPRKNHSIEAIVDRIVLRPGVETRLAESTRLALSHGEGAVVISYLRPAAEGEPATAKGYKESDKNRWREEVYSTQYACPNCKASFEELEPRTFSFNSPYGACPGCEGLGYKVECGERIVCPICHGARLRAEARACRFGGLTIHEVTALAAGQAAAWFAALPTSVREHPVSRPILSEITGRLDYLLRVGVDYLTLDRPADTLSGGEMQRVRLATLIGAGLVGVCYVLDEPSIGLHPRDNQRLIDALAHLQQQGNTVIVVEHDAAIMRQADHLIDMGPGAGLHGGQIVSQGTPEEVIQDAASLTGRYLRGELSVAAPGQRRQIVPSRKLKLTGASTNNLKNVDVSIPLGVLVCVTGVSGSGKSSLVSGTLAPALAQHLGLATPPPGPHTGLYGERLIDKLIPIDQSPIGRNPRSNPATYTGIFDEMRRVLAGTREARQRGYKASRFSFNVKGGRCEECQGQGTRRIEMNFLPDLLVTCPVCRAARFNAATLEIRYRGLSIADMLSLRVDEALAFFENFPHIVRSLASLRDVGLGYVALGQSATTLSGGEAQRVKLAAELARVETGNTLYILDEPTTGLHFDDIGRLLRVLNRLVDAGNTVLVIEHNLDVMKSADWIIDLGPEGGEAGGQITATGTPEDLAALAGNHTGEYLKRALAREEA